MVMIGFLVRGRVMIKIRIRVRIKVWVRLHLTLAFTIGAIVPHGCTPNFVLDHLSVVCFFRAISAKIGLGIGFSVVSAFNIVAMYFSKRYGLAQGIMSLGTSVGQIGIPPLVRLLISWYGWRGTLQIASAFFCHGVAAACLLRPIMAKVGNEKETSLLSLAISKGLSNDGFECNDTIDLEERHQSSGYRGGAGTHKRRELDDENNEVQDRPNNNSSSLNVVLDAVCVHRAHEIHGYNGNIEQSNTSMQNRNFAEEKEYSLPLSSIETRRNSYAKAVASEIHDIGDDHHHSSRSQVQSDISQDDAGMDAMVFRTRVQRVGKGLADMFGINLFLNEPLAILQNLTSFVIMIGIFTPVALN